MPKPFVKGDPRIVTYKKGDGRKRNTFKKGYDPRRISNERLQEVNFQKGNTLASQKDTHKTHRQARADLIPAEFQVEVSPEMTAKELLPHLDAAIQFGERMLLMVGATITVENMQVVGRYTVLLNKCIKTRAEVEGGGISPAKYGKLPHGAVEEMKREFAGILHVNLTKLTHGINFAETHDVFCENGQVHTWAGDGYCWLISGVRMTIENRARLDLWEKKNDKKADAIMAAYRETLEVG